MTARLLVIGLDAAEPTLIDEWAGEGRLPHFAALMRRAAAFIPDNKPLRTLPGAIWPEIISGVSCGRIGQYYHPGQLHTGEAERRPIDPSDVDVEAYYWVRAARAGLKVAALDMPHSYPAPDIGGVQLFDWGAHDRHTGICSFPASYLDNVKARFGDHPVADCEAHDGTPESYAELRAQLLRGVELKTALIADTLRSDRWDLLTACYGETHCVGHQFWHFHDAGHPRHDPDAPAEFKSTVFDIYALIDKGLGELIEAAGPDAEIIVVASHGMGRFFGGPNILSEVLVRLGLSSAEDTGAGRLARSVQRGHGRISRAVRAIARPLLGRARLRAIQARLGALREPLANPNTKAAPLPNNRVGAVRINLRDREPNGAVAPGNEAAAMVDDIRVALHELRDARSGAPVVAETFTPREAFGAAAHPDVPDLMVVFREDVGEIGACQSERLGELNVPTDVSLKHRTGDHTSHSRVWIVSPRTPPSAPVAKGALTDLAPTVLDLLNLPADPPMDGRSLLS